LNTRKE
jgi:hypothetical protein